MLRILETELISDFADGFAGVEYFFFCDIDQFGLDMFGSGFPGLFFLTSSTCHPKIIFK